MIPDILHKEVSMFNSIPKQLSNPSFVQDTTLWHKEKHFCGFNQKELVAKRYPFFKMGKVLGL